MPSKWPATEVELARPVVAWLESQGWDVYQEVQTDLGPIADIVATQGPLVWVVECKKALGLPVLEQAEHWLHYAHFVTAAYPYVPNRRNRLARRVAEWLGIGLLEVRHSELWRLGVDLQFTFERPEPPRFTRDPKLKDLLTKHLLPGQRTFAEAGNALGLRYTPYRETCDLARDYVRQHPGAQVREVVENIRHHYKADATARACLLKWAQEGKLHGVRLEQDGRALRLYEATP
jgi:Holliday junction resolvase